MRAHRRRNAPRLRPGVTIPEMLVAMSIVAIISAVVLPNVLRHLDEAETTRLVNDVSVAGESARMFRLHVRRWPSKVPHLIERPASGDLDALGDPIPDRLIDDWKGPYIELKKIADVPGELNPVIITSRGSWIRNEFSTARWQEHTWLQVEVAKVDIKHARLVSQALDGDTIVGVASLDEDNPDAGRVRWITDASGNQTGSMLYLAARID